MNAFLIVITIVIAFFIHVVILKYVIGAKGDYSQVSDRTKGISLLVSLIFVGISIFALYNHLNPGSGKYYVYMSPSDSSTKSYRLPADVEQKEDGLYLKKVYFPNGGYLTFDESMFVYPVSFNKRVTVKDDKGDYWEAELTKSKAE